MKKQGSEVNMTTPTQAAKTSNPTEGLTASPSCIFLTSFPTSDGFTDKDGFAGEGDVVGAAGNLLRKIILDLPEPGLTNSGLRFVSVFPRQPPSTNIKEWTVTKTEAKKRGALGLPPIDKRYLLPNFYPMVEATKKLIHATKPKLVVCLGGIAQWCLSGDSRIGMFRGTIFAAGAEGPAAISTYSPENVLREWSFYPTVWADLTKAARYLSGTIQPPIKRRLYYSPTEEELATVYTKFKANPNWLIGVDIETAPAIGQITCIGFSTPSLGICLPFWDPTQPSLTQRPAQPGLSPSAEGLLWRWAERFCKLPNPKVLQNGMYDLQYMLDAPLPLILNGRIEDTVLLSHSMQPELPKSLGHLASIYTNEPSWKQMRTKKAFGRGGKNKDAKAEE